MPKSISKSLFIASFIRTFFIQSVWNFERMQNVGFAYVMLPFIRGLYTDKEKRQQVLARHLGFFNTHPYMVGIILGIVADMEREKLKNSDITDDEITLLKTNMAGPLAAIGDTFFWATWKPFSAIVSCVFVLLFFGHSDFHGTWLPPVIFLVLFNMVHLPFRYWSMWLSYEYRAKTVKMLGIFEFQKVISILRKVGLIVLALMFFYYVFAFSSSAVEMIIFSVVFVLSIIFSFLNTPPVVIFYGIVVIGAVISMLRMVNF